MAKKDSAPTWLKEVKLAAQYNYLRHKREQEENQRVAAAKRDGSLEDLVNDELALARGEKTSSKTEAKKEGK